MAHYIDGYAFPIPSQRLADYQQLAEATAAIWKEHGALDYREYVRDDVDMDGTRSFIDATEAGDGEIVVFGWVTFASREDRDRVHQRVVEDPRMLELMESSSSGFDGHRMVFGGFRPLVPAAEATL